MLSYAFASAKEAAPDQTMPAVDAKPKPVPTTVIKRCPEGFELVLRVNGRRGCAKDVIPAID